MVSGVVVAMVTPFRSDGSLDVDSFRKLITLLEEAGVNGIFVGGTTGESLYLGVNDRLRLLENALAVRKGIKVFGSLMAATVEEALSYARRLKEVGVDGFLATPPIYYKPSIDRLAEFYVKLADTVDAPIMVYTISGYVGYRVPVEAVRRAALEHSGVAGIKATEPDLHYIHELVARVKAERRDFTVLTGFGEYLLDALLAGADGTIDALTNLVPRLLVSIYRSWTEGRVEDAVKGHRLLAALAVEAASSPSLIKLLKALLARLNIIASVEARVPEPEPSPETVDKVYRLVCTDYRSYLVARDVC